MNEFVQIDADAGIGRLILNRPDKRNALKRQFIQEINDGVQQLSQDPSVRVLVLSGVGSVFCAGMDLGEMQERAQSGDGQQEWRRDSEVYADLLARIFQLQIPTIAAVQGPALAGGMGLVLACDMVVASESAFFMLPEPMRGITAAMVTPFLLHRVGSGPATFMLLSGEKISAGQAATFGMCHCVVPANEFDDRVARLTAAVLTGAPAALAITKHHLQNCLAVDPLSYLEESMKVSAEARETVDAREGLAAFLEKRKPSWQPATSP